MEKFVKVSAKTGFSVTGGGGGRLITLRTCPQLIVFFNAFPKFVFVKEDVQQYYSQPLRFTTEDATVTAINVTGLQPDTKYKVQVQQLSILTTSNQTQSTKYRYNNCLY